MTDRSRQPAVLLRRLEKLEALLKAEREMFDRKHVAYIDMRHKLVNAELKVRRVEAALRDDE